MRSERKRRRTFLARFMVLFMIINLLSGVNPSVLKADEGNYYKNGEPTTDGGITISKNVTKYDSDSEEFEIELKVKGDSSVEHIQKSLDVVLVMDTSGSMNATRMNNAKKAAKAFVNKLINNTSSKKTKIGIVKFATTGEEVSGLTDKKNKLINKINELSSGGGTYTQEGLKKAEEILNQSGADKKVMIVISDGEPTYAYGKYPDFSDWEKISGFPNKINPDTEIWHGTNLNWIGKGYNSKFKNYIVKLKTGEIGDGTSTYIKYTLDYWLDHFGYFITLPVETAKNIRKSNIDIYSVGIGLNKNEKAKAVMKGISSNNKYAETGEDGELLNNVLANLAEDITSNKIEKGSISDSMGQYVNYQDGSLIITGTKDGKADDGLNEIIGKLVSKHNNNVLTIDGITLGKGEELSVKYKVKLKDNWKDGKFHPANGTTTLLPVPNGTSMKFNVPEVKAVAATTSLTIKKQWVGNNVPANVYAVKFNIKADGVKLDNQIEVKKDNNWTEVINDLPKYKAGSEIKYTVEEIAGKDYAQVGDVVPTHDKDGNLIFTATNRNTETINFTVKKDWANTPGELKFDAEVTIFADGKPGEHKEFEDNLAVFKNLPKYDAEGKKIDYTVKEMFETGQKEENGQITFGEYIYKVDYLYTENGATITNTSTNASSAKFEAKVKKHWVGGASLNDLKFVFKNEATNSEGQSVKMSAAGFTNEEWEAIIKLPKYNDDNSLATYTVTEEKVEGYTANKDKVTGINANNTIAEFTNTRNTKSITVIKEWNDTPESLKRDVEVVLTENDEVSRRTDAVKIIKNDAEHKVVYKNLPETDTKGNKIEYSVKENDVEAGFEPNVTKDNEGNIVVTNTYKKLKEDTISVTLKKVWVGGEGNNATFNFINKKTRDAQIVLLSADTKDLIKNDDKNGHVTWTYEVKELRKYDDDANIIDYIVEEVTNNAYTLKGNNSIEVKAGDTATFTNVRVESKLTLEKEWIGEAADQAKFKLEGGGVSKEFTLTKDKNWKENVDLPVYDLDGNVINYTITEESNEGYKAVEPTQTFNFVDPANPIGNRSVKFTNVELLKPQFTVHKTWVGEPASKATFGLFADGKSAPVDTLELTGKNAKTLGSKVWEGVFKKEIPAKDINGHAIKYVVKELDAAGKPVDDEVILEDRTFNVVGTPARDTANTYNFKNTDITKTDISVTKTWLGKVPLYQLVRFGLFKKTPEGLVNVSYNTDIDRTNASKWIVSYKNVPAVDEQGNKIEYVIKEVFGDTPDAVNTGDTVTLGKTNYKVFYDDKGNITNTELIDLTVKKEWGKNVPDIAKHSVKFRITDDSRSDKNGKSYLLNEANGWKMDFTELPLYDVKGEKINYTVVETEINGDKVDVGDDYTKYHHSAFEINVENAENITKSQTITIKNSIVNANNDDPDNRTINVVKGWSAGADRKSVTVKLYKLDTAKGEIVPVENGETELRDGNHWQTKFEVPKKDKAGNEILYYAFETAVGNVEVDESKLSPNLYNEGYQIGEYEVSIAELIGDAEGEEYGFYILNTANNKEVKQEEKVNINVTKKWLIPDNSEYVKPVRVRLFIKAGEYLVPVSDATDLTLDTSNNWNGKFADLDKFNNDGDQIEYYVAEVGVDDYTKEITSLDQISGVNGYTIGRYNAYIDGNGTDNVVISNDVALIDVTAVKNWVGATPRQTVEFTLYSKQGENLVSTGKKVTLNGTDENTVATFTELPRLDNEGKPVVYYVYETKIGETPITFNLTPVETMNYSLGINGGVYAVTVSDNGTVGDKVVIISNSFTGTPVVPGGIPVIPVVTPDPLPTPTPNPSTPVVDIPNDPSPQVPATPVNDGDEDNGVTEIDEDDVPQGDGKEVKKDNKANKDTVDIADNKAPKGTANLPKTGGEAGNFLSIIGLGLIGLGLVIRRRR